MPAVANLQPAGGRVEHRVGGGRHRILAERLHEPVDELERPARAVTLDRVGVQRGPQPAHQRRGPQPVTDDVADREADPPARKLEHVVPVAAHLLAGREVASGGLHPDDVGKPAR